MFMVLFAYAIALLLFGNAAHTDSTFLFWVDWLVGVYYVFVGSLAGWAFARTL